MEETIYVSDVLTPQPLTRAVEARQSEVNKTWLWIGGGLLALALGVIVAVILHRRCYYSCTKAGDCAHICEGEGETCVATCKDGTCIAGDPAVLAADADQKFLQTMKQMVQSDKHMMSEQDYKSMMKACRKLSEMSSSMGMDYAVGQYMAANQMKPDHQALCDYYLKKCSDHLNGMDYDMHAYSQMDADMHKKYLKYLKGGNGEKFVAVCKKVMAACKKQQDDGVMTGKDKKGKEYLMDVKTGLMQMKDKFGQWWTKGSEDFWWLMDKDGTRNKKDSAGNMWKLDSMGTVWKRKKGSSKWEKGSAAMDMPLDIELGKQMYAQMQMGAPASAIAAMGASALYNESLDAEYFDKPTSVQPLGLDKVAAGDNYGFDYDPYCGYPTRVNLYGQSYALDEPYDVSNGMVASMILNTPAQRTVPANISQYGTNPEMMGYDTTHKQYYPIQ